MKRKSVGIKWVWNWGLFGIAILIAFLLFSNARNPVTPAQAPTQSPPLLTIIPQRPTPAPPTNTPIGYAPVTSNTATPKPGEIRPDAPLPPTFTPLPVTETKDLAPELSEDRKAKVTVRAPDGTYRIFFTRPEVDPLKDLPLKLGEIVVNIMAPKSMMGGGARIVMTPIVTRPPAPLLTTFTPLPVTEIIDLAPELSEANKVKVYVQHTTGTYRIFFIKPDEEMLKNLPLRSGERIVDIIPPRPLMGHQPTLAANEPILTPSVLKTPTIAPYPIIPIPTR